MKVSMSLIAVGGVFTILGIFLLMRASYKAGQNNPVWKYESHRIYDYQINLHMDTVWVYDDRRFVGMYITNWNNQIDTIILKDNQ